MGFPCPDKDGRIEKMLVIFDLDGVLADACALHRDALNKALSEVTGWSIPDSDLPIYEGRPTKVKLRIMSDNGYIQEEQVPLINKRKQELTKWLLENKFDQGWSIYDALYSIYYKSTIAIVTNSVRASAELMIKKLHITPLVDLLVSNEDVREPKPSPEGLLAAMKTFGVEPAGTIYFGDQPVDEVAASAARISNFVKVNSPEDITVEFLDECLKKAGASDKPLGSHSS